ncbi:MAG TPA: site-specific integrase [Pseudogracilibacillus sp.]|nr:site-specific integrase [Pseudogracilibacillus sp.]
MARGHVRHRGGKKYQLEVDLGKKVGGKGRNKKYRTVKAAGITDAKTKLAQFVAELTNEGYIEETKIGFVEFVDKEWMPKCGTKRLAHTTLDSFIKRLNKHIIPAFQYFRLDEIKPRHIIDFLDNMSEDGMRSDGKEGKLSSSSIFFYYRILNNIFNFAVEIHFLRESPLKGVKKPSVDYKESDVFNAEETLKLIAALESETAYPHWQVIIKLAITTGLRRSELYGLEFKHFNLEEKMLYVRQALTYSKSGGYQIHDIKKGSRSAKQRDIVLSDALIEPIKKLRLLRKKERMMNVDKLWKDGKYDFLLCNEYGHPYNPSSMIQWWKKFLKRHNLKYINVHALRHTSATLLINEGVHPKIISERLGHADIKTTMNVYGHVLRKADTIASSKLDDLLFKDSKPQ